MSPCCVWPADAGPSMLTSSEQRELLITLLLDLRLLHLLFDRLAGLAPALGPPTGLHAHGGDDLARLLGERRRCHLRRTVLESVHRHGRTHVRRPGHLAQLLLVGRATLAHAELRRRLHPGTTGAARDRHR